MKLSLFAVLCVVAGGGVSLRAEGWQLHPEAVEQAGVPRGVVSKMEPWHSKIYPGTVRDWWVYFPAQVKGARELALMVFQDGHDYVGLKGRWRVPTVLDNLTAKGEMPATVAVFVDPGHDVNHAAAPTPWKNSNRSLEYDSLGESLCPVFDRGTPARGGKIGACARGGVESGSRAACGWRR